MFIIVDLLDVIGCFSEMNPFILSKSGFVRKKLGKYIACTCMEYTFRGKFCTKVCNSKFSKLQEYSSKIRVIFLCMSNLPIS